MCLYPKIIHNPKYKPNKKNGGQTPAVIDKRVLYVPIGCGNCIECRKQKARQWHVRLLEDIKTNTNGKFITLTFSNQSYKELAEEIQTKWQITGYELDNQIATLATRRFLERWRKEYTKSLRHWLVTELGHNGTENIHLHGIIWPTTNTQFDTLASIWNYGYVWPRLGTRQHKTNYVNSRTITYITKYVTKLDVQHKYYKSQILTSPGIGANYTQNKNSGNWQLNRFKGENTIETYRTESGHKIAMPTYWRNKIYTETEREKLWMQKLDKEIRYVLGQEIDVSNNFNEYINALETARNLNTQLGYGNDKIDWKRKEYEKIIREIKQLTRINSSLQGSL